MTKKKTLNEFLLEAKSVHGDRYDYSNAQYKNSKSRVDIICATHGQFSQPAGEHLSGKGCRKCGTSASAASRSLSLAVFLQRASLVHQDTYDYAKVTDSKNNLTKVTITCRTHGDFQQSISGHLAGKGCIKCSRDQQAKDQTYTQEEALTKFKSAHGDTYDYSDTVYTATYAKVTITCRKHGKFTQNPNAHWSGRGCVKCFNEKTRQRLTKDTAWFIEASQRLHGDTYNYTESEYLGSKIPVTILCDKGHKFKQRPNDHLTGHGCSICLSTGVSEPEDQIQAYLESLGVECQKNDRKTLKGKEIDLLVGGIGIEFNGLYWHSETAGKSSKYHKEKTGLAKSQGISLIHIFEDEWLYQSDIVKARLAAKFGKSEKTQARKMQVKQVAWSEAKNFYTEHHLQGAGQAGTSLGLYLGDLLMACITVGYRNKVHELLRYASIGTVVGGFSRLFKHFVTEHPEIARIVSYADLRWGEGNVYGLHGFNRVKDTVPGYFWCKKLIRYPRQRFQKHKLEQLLPVFDPALTEVQNMLNNKYYRIYDCGHAKWVWER